MPSQLNLRTAVALVLLAWGLAWGQVRPEGPEQKDGSSRRDVIFLVTSDCHYDAFENEDRNERNRDTLKEMNAITKASWPEALGGGPTGRPRGVLVLGDVIDDGDRVLEGRHQTPRQWACFVADFGMDGSDGLLRYPVYEGWGNHDGPPVGKERFGFSFQAQLKKRNLARRERGWLTGLSENTLHYSWDWDDVHFVQLNIYPADRQHDDVKYSATWHDPQGALTFLRKDLATHVGGSRRPVVVMSHCGFDTDWWHPDDWRAVYDAMRPYNVLLYLYGHSGTGVREWAPEGEAKPLDCVNTGQTERGFFVVHIDSNRLRLAYRLKEGLQVSRDPDGTLRHEWDGRWGWRWPWKKEVEAPTPARN